MPVSEEKPAETITERSEAKTENKSKAKPAGESKKKETASKLLDYILSQVL